MTLIDKDAVIAAINNCFGDTVYQVMEQGTFTRKALDAINALPVKTIVNIDMEDDKPLDVSEAIRNAFKPNKFSLHIKPLSETIYEINKARDDALKEVERLKARLALAEEVMEKMAGQILLSRKDGDTWMQFVAPPERVMAHYGWTKEDTDAMVDE